MDIQKLYEEGFDPNAEYLGKDKEINSIEPLVSVCTATYQHANYIKDCIEGILMQETDFPIEIIIGEDESTDGTREICKKYAEKYPDKIRLFLRNRGTSCVFNEKGERIYGFNGKWTRKSANGKYIALCEGDDYWTDPLKLQKQVDILEKNRNVGIVHTGFIIYDMINNEKIEEILNIVGDPKEHYLVTGKMRTLTVMLRTELLTKVNEVRKNPVLKRSPYGDRVTFLTVASKSNVAYLPDITGVYRKHPNVSVTRSKKIGNKYTKRLKMTRVNIELLNVLNIENHKYRRHLEFKILKTRVILFLLKHKPMQKLYDFLYHKIGLGTYKGSDFY